MTRKRAPLTYRDYLGLDTLLACQRCESAKAGRPAHDEHLFIIVHQTYELWFKQILFELDEVQRVFAGDVVDDRAIGSVVHGLGRIAEILRLLIQQLEVLETMTPLDFLDFRDLLFPASGSQSLQFRLIETRLGLRARDRLSFDGRPVDANLSADERERFEEASEAPSLVDQVERWLERTPFVDMGDYHFRDSYRQTLQAILDGDARLIRASTALREADREKELAGLAAARERFDGLFDEAVHRRLVEAGAWRMSARALQAALFVNLYRDEPALQLPFRLLSLLMDIDEQLTTWRYRHALMVQRMIGLKVGTGGSSGHDYLRRTAEQHHAFGDLFALSTFFIPRSQLPPLPPEVRRAMSYRYTEDEAP
ncbi:MAG TPA: tryptophan 2,3-dioxygenase family protein [Dongiaceae bacterium]|nr:tryptophan 2,3-dioxygenase family protein [Dongiaceae bacterium]